MESYFRELRVSSAVFAEARWQTKPVPSQPRCSVLPVGLNEILTGPLAYSTYAKPYRTSAV